VDDAYWMFYQHNDKEVLLGDNISVGHRMAVYEHRVDLILDSEPVTSDCEVTIGSVNFGKSGSGSTTKVLCSHTLPLEKDDLYNKNGSPNYRCFLERVSGT
jgi:hypothetical protein